MTNKISGSEGTGPWLLPPNTDSQELLGYQRLLEEKVEELRAQHFVGTVRKSDDRPFSIAFTESGKEILLLNELLGEGAFTAAKLAWDLKGGGYLVKKRISHAIPQRQEQVYRMFEDVPGAVGAVAFRRIPRTNILSKMLVGAYCKEQVFEPLMEGTLNDLLKEKLSPRDKISILLQLAQSLADMHSTGIDHHLGWTYLLSSWLLKQQETASFLPRTIGVPFYHGDLHAANILYNRDDDGAIKVFISDFNTSLEVEQYSRHGLPCSPDIAFCRDYEPNQLPDYLSKWGQTGDIWALGLLFSQILSGDGASLLKESQLGELRYSIQADAFIFHYDNLLTDAKLSAIVQNSVSKKLKKLNLVDQGEQALAQAWQLIPEMLQMNPDSRCEATALVAALEEIQNQLPE